MGEDVCEPVFRKYPAVYSVSIMPLVCRVAVYVIGGGWRCSNWTGGSS